MNAPVELPARKEALKPEEATIEVHVKPGNSSAAIGERYVEGIVRSVLEDVVLVRDKAFARRGVVINLLIEKGATAERADSVSFFYEANNTFRRANNCSTSLFSLPSFTHPSLLSSPVPFPCPRRLRLLCLE